MTVAAPTGKKIENRFLPDFVFLFKICAQRVCARVCVCVWGGVAIVYGTIISNQRCNISVTNIY